ncbi:MAG: zinc ribbon domain-containing protein, partial [Myxococcota bacterium]
MADAPQACPQCGTAIRPGTRFCGSCGFDLATVPASIPAPPPASPAPPHASPATPARAPARTMMGMPAV